MVKLKLSHILRCDSAVFLLLLHLGSETTWLALYDQVLSCGLEDRAKFRVNITNLTHPSVSFLARS